MRTIITLCALVAVTFAASVDLLVAKDIISNPAEGGVSQYHNADKYSITCCSASNPSYIYTAYNIASLSGKQITSVFLNVNVLSNVPPQQVSPADNSKNPNVDFYTATDFSEARTTNINDFPSFVDEIQKVYLSNAATSKVDVTSFVKTAVAANKQFFNVAWNPTGGYSASVTVASRDANPRSSFLTVVYSEGVESQEPTATHPAVEYCDANLSGDNNASPARTVSQSCANANLSGDNNAAPARRFRTAVCSGNGVCQGQVCKCNNGFKGSECETACIPSSTTTSAPAQSTSAPSTSAPTVNLTPKPTTAQPTACPTCPCGSEANLSGDNNASPARGTRTECPVCKACPSTSAPTVNLTPKPATTQAPATTKASASTSTPQNESGEDNAKESSATTTIIAGAAAVAAAAAAML